MPSLRDTPFWVGDWRVQPRQHRLVKEGEAQPVEPKVMQVLLCLAERPGDVVSREDLLETVWPDVIVSERVLTRAVSELRKVFDDDPRDPAYIETIIKSGYRLVAPVRPNEGTEGKHSPSDMADRPVQDAGHSSPRHGLPRSVWLGLVSLLALTGMAVLGLHLTRPAVPFEVPLAAQPLTTFSSWEYDPALSPDGQRVAFAWNGTDAQSWDIYVKVIGTETPLQLTDEPGADGSPAWSPDGRFIAYYRYTGRCALYVQSALGGGERKLTDCNAKYPDLSWSPDGSWLVFNEHDEAGGAHRLVLLAPETGEKRPLTHPPSHIQGDRSAVFSPDGTTVAFTRSMSEGLQDLYLVSVEDGAVQRLTTETRNIYGVDWTPDGEGLVFSSNRDGISALWHVALNSGRLTRLTTNDRAGNPSLRGGHLVYERWSSTTNLWQASLHQDRLDEPSPLITSTQWDLHPALAPDGDRVAFSSNRSGHYEIWLREDATTAPRRLTFFDGPFVGTPRWSPDGTRLVFDARPDGQADLYVVNADGSNVRQLTTHPSDDVAAHWSPDGQWIYFASSRSGGWQVWKIPSSGGTPVQVTRAGGFAAIEHPEDGALYYTRPDQPGLWRLTRTDSTSTLVLDELPIPDWGSWAITQAGILYLRRSYSPRVDSLMLYRFASGTVAGLGALPYPVPSGDPALSVSPDGSRILVGQVERRACDLMLVDGLD